MKSIKDLDVNNKLVLIRADLNVPLDEKKSITDDSRIKGFLPTLKNMLERNARCVVMSHLGEPKSPEDKSCSLEPVFTYLKEKSKLEVKFSRDCIGKESFEASSSLEPGQVLLLENLRFHAGEKKNDPEFSKLLAKHGEIFVNDAFGTCHREHASMVGVPRLFDTKAVGLLIEKELEAFKQAFTEPKKPLCIILGGSKVSTKLQLLNNIVDKADKLIIGGAMANTFLAAQGLQVGRSLFEPDLTDKALEILGRLAVRRCAVYLPVDLIVAPSINSVGLSRAVTSLEIPADTMALDMGPATNLLFTEALQGAETILWNGPVGAYEFEEFSVGTDTLVKAVAQAHGVSVVGGGDTDAAIHKMGLAHKFDHISTGGGAFLALMEGVELPGIKALR
jgi:phosphoglycerate kinase